MSGSTPYRRLQLRAKQRGIPANQKAAVLTALLDAPDGDDGPRASSPADQVDHDDHDDGRLAAEAGVRRRVRGRAVKPPPPPPGWGHLQQAAVAAPAAPASAARILAKLGIVRRRLRLTRCQWHLPPRPFSAGRYMHVCGVCGGVRAPQIQPADRSVHGGGDWGVGGTGKKD